MKKIQTYVMLFVAIIVTTSVFAGVPPVKKFGNTLKKTTTSYTWHCDITYIGFVQYRTTTTMPPDPDDAGTINSYKVETYITDTATPGIANAITNTSGNDITVYANITGGRTSWSSAYNATVNTDYIIGSTTSESMETDLLYSDFTLAINSVTFSVSTFNGLPLYADLTYTYHP